MKKLLNLAATLSLTVSTAASVVACGDIKTIDVKRLNLNLNDIVVSKITQKDLMLAIIKNNEEDLKNISEQEIERYAALSFEQILKIADDEYEAYLMAAPYSNILKGRVKFTFKVNNSDDTTLFEEEANTDGETPNIDGEQETGDSEIADENSGTIKIGDKVDFHYDYSKKLAGYWYAWGNGSTDFTLDKAAEKDYDIINLGFGEGGNDGIELWMGVFDEGLEKITSEAHDQALTRNSCFVNPNFTIWGIDKTCYNPDASKSFLTEDTNKKLTESRADAKERGQKYVVSIGGSTNDRMTLKWSKKDFLKKQIKESVVDKLNLDGIELSLTGRSMADIVTKKVLSQISREIKLEKWLNNEDFLITTSPRFEYLDSTHLELHGTAISDLNDALDGYLDITSPSVYNIFNEYNLKFYEDAVIDGIKIPKDTIAPRRVHNQTEIFYYAFLKILTDENWARYNNFETIKYGPIQIAINSLGRFDDEETKETENGILYTTFNASNFTNAYNALDEEAKERIIGFNNYAINDNLGENYARVVDLFNSIFNNDSPNVDGNGDGE
ncbi:hypothetical protein SCHIN_v1c08950 [Spiroplasma chinense]|uniref:Chitinase n=1 Tax=Spiroplasma chinense TaxID=216932 RepID=A0A5B9Y555_9MOLU|nr:hypothetical protein [Spiroplasma chinense]QEH62090.1 hypothetical protein SCHIN_v1c08950 [Spiroplasma chinense]